MYCIRMCSSTTFKTIKRMSNNVLKSFLVILTVTACLAVPISRKVENIKVFHPMGIDRLSSQVSLDNDFESGYSEPWYDNSPSTVHWVIENYSYPAENYQPPPPSVGTKYLRAVRDSHLTPGFLTLRTVTFTAFPGDEISFNFWIHSKYTGGNTLEVVQFVDGVETIFLVLSEFSTPWNVNWLVASSPLPVTEPTLVTLIFYAFCGGSAEDAIAIDDIAIKSFVDSTTAEVTTPIRTTDFTSPTSSCIGDLCSTNPDSSSTFTPTNTPMITTVFTPPTVPCIGCSTSSTTVTPTTPVFTPPTVPCIGSACSTSSTTVTPTTPVFTPPTAPCIGSACPTSSTTVTPTTPDFCPTTVFTPPTVPCIDCPTTTSTTVITVTPSTPCISKSAIISPDEGKQIVIQQLGTGLLTARALLNNDFESGAAYPWYDSSPFSVHWVVEDFSSPTEDYSSPTPLSGNKYLRATRDALQTPGQLILRTLTFTAFPGDEVSFNFWIRSKYTGGNTLELVLSNGKDETTLIELSSYSTSVNFEWRPMSTPIPVSGPTDVTLIFLAFCGGYPEDAIAIDNIVATPTTTPTTPTTTLITPTATIPTNQCGGSYNVASGSFSSTNYPSPYGFDEECRYEISIPSGNAINLTFTYFNTENGFDFVTVYDGPTAVSPVLLRISGYNINPSVTTTGRDCLVLHTSNSKNSLTGWTATYFSI